MLSQFPGELTPPFVDKKLRLGEMNCLASNASYERANQRLDPQSLDSLPSAFPTTKYELKQNETEKVKNNSQLHQRMKESLLYIIAQETKGYNLGIYFKFIKSSHPSL